MVERGYRAFKTNVVVPGEEPRVLMPGFGRDGGTVEIESESGAGNSGSENDLAHEWYP